MKSLLNFFEQEKIEAFGLDVGSAAVKLVKMAERPDGKYVATGIACEQIAKAPENSTGDNAKNTVAAIERCVKKSSFNHEYVVCAVRGPEVAVRSFSFPKMPIEEIGKAVLLEAEQVCPFDISQSVLDYNLTDSGNGKIHGVFVAATADVVTKRSQLIRKASLSPLLMDAETLAILNCFNYCKMADNQQTYGILNMGSKFVNLIICSKDTPPFVRDLQYSGNDMINWFADSNKITPEKAYSAIFGLPDSGFEQSNVSGGLNMSCRNMVNDVAETLRYYATNNNGRQVERIFVCGGFACAANIISLLKGNLYCDVLSWNPFDKIEIDPSLNREDVVKNGPSMAIAAGLAMRRV